MSNSRSSRRALEYMQVLTDLPWSVFWYGAPFAPLITRGLLISSHWKLAADVLSKEQLDREASLGVALTLTGFSFSAVIALALLQPSVTMDLQLPLYLLFVSFLTLLTAANGESYKGRRWEDQLVTAVREIGTLALTLGLVVLIVAADFGPVFEASVSTLAIGLWLLDHLVRVRIQWKYLSDLTEVIDAET